MKILLHYPFDEDQVKIFQDVAAEYDSEILFTTDDDEAISLAHDVEVMIGFFKPPVCAAAPHLKWIQSFSAGMDHFLFPEIIERDVKISNAAGLHAPQGGEHAWAMLLALARGIRPGLENMHEKRWGGVNVVEVSGGTLGLIGLGGFGLEMLKRAQGYDMTVLALDAVRTEKPEGVAELKQPTTENLHALLERSDAVMTACPLTKETYHLFGAEEFKRMKSSAFLINVTRGGIVDEDALVEALKNGEIAGAALDVCETEPLPENSPLWTAPNLLLTPHRAGASQHRASRLFEFFVQNLERYLKGEPVRNVVDKERGF
ncbi:MAG: D-2-hydroxyacid dehydrogenase (NADP+) [Candidatus Latescibacterota bacterium]|jgi:D-2-hydroxyacid dehydrogenase (NADP+)